jgi:putative flippase GtrA
MVYLGLAHGAGQTGMNWQIMLSRYAFVGLTTNAIGYLLYLLLTSAGLAPKAAMSLLYAVGVAFSFCLNRGWSFGHYDVAHAAFGRYVAAYAFGYVFNLFALMLMVDRWGWPHRWVQGFLIFLVAGMLFLLQVTWVFRSERSRFD